jgi:multidrug resistance efflux pump
MPVTKEQISEIISAAQEMIAQGQQDIAQTSSQSLKDAIFGYSKEIQSVLNNLLSKTGVVTEEEINNLDEQLRIAKKEIEFQKAEETKRKVLITIGLLVVGFGTLWFITKSRK